LLVSGCRSERPCDSWRSAMQTLRNAASSRPGRSHE